METLEALAARLETADDVRAIVRVMKSLSLVSIEQYDRAVAALHDYRRCIDMGLQAVLREGPDPAPETVRPRARMVIAVGSDRGLCGRFNETVVAFARRELLAPDRGPKPRVLAVGLRGADRLAQAWGEPDAVQPLPGAAEGLASAAKAILVRLDAWQRETGPADIRICFNRRQARAVSRPKWEQISPVDPHRLRRLAAARWPGRGLPMRTMARGELLSWLLREDLYLSVYRALARSLAAEHAARLAAMQAAERNIDERKDDLIARHRKKRQETITAELLDIVSGFETTGRDDAGPA